MKYIYKIELLTPSFCKIGNGKPEIRGTSIRGMIREWKELLGGNADAVWGGRGGNASKVGIAMKNVEQEKGTASLLPHKGGTKQQAILAGATFDLILTRLVGCTDKLWEEAQKDVSNWLLLGCLGQRANRAAGSVWNTNWYFSSKQEFINQCPDNIEIRISNEGFDDAAAVRTIASDTVKVPRYFGSFKPRESSPTKMKVIKIGSKYHLLMFAARDDILDGAIRELKVNKVDKTNWNKITL